MRSLLCILLNENSSRPTIYLAASSPAQITFVADYSLLGDHDLNGNNITYTSTHEVHGSPMLNSGYHLKKGSPAIDAGICGIWRDIYPFGYVYTRIAPYDDIDGDKRPGFGTYLGCDIGADEYKPFPWPMFLPAIVHQQLNP